jgi:hypothetical protein
MKILGLGIVVVLLGLGLTLIISQRHGDRPSSASMSTSEISAISLSTPPNAATSSVMVYIKVVIDKKYGALAHLVGGKHDNLLQHTVYDVANPWWSNPLIVHADAAIDHADVTGRTDAQALNGHGASENVTVQLTMVPHADLAIKTNPRSDCIKGTITTVIDTTAQYYDGHWVEMIHESDKPVTFTFDTCDPQQRVEVIGHETRTFPAFTLERYTRDHQKWEPKSAWPQQMESGDWHVVIYSKNAVLDVTRYRYVQ